MTIEDEITEAQSFYTDPPRNESNTCDWIILPMLHAAGYSRRDIESRVVDATGQFPDYTILPAESGVTWYLEAKAWNVPLEDVHAKQALNYANQNGKRFVVLTNGQWWRLYDNSIQGVLANKLVTDVALTNATEIHRFLRALSKIEVLGGNLERFTAEEMTRRSQAAAEASDRARREEEACRASVQQESLGRLLRTSVIDNLRDPADDLVTAITSWLQDREDFREITPESVALAFSEAMSKPRQDAPAQLNNQTPVPALRSSVFPQRGEQTLSLTAMLKLPVDGKSSRPIALQMPDGANIAVRSWVDLAEQAVRWLLEQSVPLPIPFEGCTRARWFLNYAPVHKREDQRKKFRTISANDKTVYMDTDRSGAMFLQDIYMLYQGTHVAPDGIRVTTLG